MKIIHLILQKSQIKLEESFSAVRGDTSTKLGSKRPSLVFVPMLPALSPDEGTNPYRMAKNTFGILV